MRITDFAQLNGGQAIEAATAQEKELLKTSKESYTGKKLLQMLTCAQVGDSYAQIEQGGKENTLQMVVWQEQTPNKKRPVVFLKNQWNGNNRSISQMTQSKLGGTGIKVESSAHMSRPWLGSEREGGIASLACMRAALEAADGGAARGLEKLGAGLEAPDPDAAGKYKREQFNLRHLHAAKERAKNGQAGPEKGRASIHDYDYIEAWNRFKAQANTQEARESRQAREEARYFPKRAREALVVDEMPAAGGSRRAGRPWVDEMPAGWRYRAGGPDVQEISPAEAREAAARRRARLLREADWDQVDAALEGFEYPEEELPAAYVAPKRRRLAPDPLGWDWRNDRWHSDR